jgi:hypothetical protein
MDGHGETSIPPYNFVAGGIKIYKKLFISFFGMEKGIRLRGKY